MYIDITYAYMIFNVIYCCRQHYSHIRSGVTETIWNQW